MKTKIVLYSSWTIFFICGFFPTAVLSQTYSTSFDIEENPDHFSSAHAVEAARWMAEMSTDYPEHFDAGLKPYGLRERYYYSRDTQRVNRIVDISNYIDKKVEVNMLNVTKGPAGKGEGKKIIDRLAREGKQLPLLGNDEKTANFNYVKYVVFGIDTKRLYTFFPTVSNR